MKAAKLARAEAGSSGQGYIEGDETGGGKRVKRTKKKSRKRKIILT